MLNFPFLKLFYYLRELNKTLYDKLSSMKICHPGKLFLSLSYLGHCFFQKFSNKAKRTLFLCNNLQSENEKVHDKIRIGLNSLQKSKDHYLLFLPQIICEITEISNKVMRK